MTTRKGTRTSDEFRPIPSAQTTHSAKASCFGFMMMAAMLCGMFISGLSNRAAAQQERLSASATSMDKSHWVQIPGELVRPDCVHQLPKGATIEIGTDGQTTGNVTLNGALIAHYDACPEKPIITRASAHTDSNSTHAPGTGNGWVESSSWNIPLSSSDNIDYLGNTWKVPSYPSMNGALIFLFNGIEPASEAWILQPVLQYGVSPAGGGNYWAIASWLVSANGNAYVSPLETVYPGDTIFGATGLNSVSGSTLYWKTEAKDETTGAYSWLTAHVSNQHWTLAFAGVLEAYNVSSCSQFPASGKVTFKNSVVDHGFPYLDKGAGNGWVGDIFNYGGPYCRFMVVASASSTLDF